eukprot:TRINITY_DN601_c0_g1_i2.p1 TRINITY_DN601_c0_g1~~TRINITY_DN601_c0_g1_i2.p1  ORF type:complete len:248 (-),score=-26.64 TRINITY_DN601_c0_g1_i2:81-824(-)
MGRGSRTLRHQVKRRKPKKPMTVVVLIGMLLHQLWRSQRLDLDTCAGDDCVIIGASEDLSSAASSEWWRQTLLEDHACKNPDILKSYKGITVETGSTDVGEDSSCGHYKLDSKQFQVHSHSAPSLAVYVIAISKTSYLAYQKPFRIMILLAIFDTTIHSSRPIQVKQCQLLERNTKHKQTLFCGELLALQLLSFETLSILDSTGITIATSLSIVNCYSLSLQLLLVSPSQKPGKTWNRKQVFCLHLF